MISEGRDKERIRKMRARKKKDKERRHNPHAKSLRHFRHQIVETKEKGGAKNLIKEIEKETNNDE